MKRTENQWVTLDKAEAEVLHLDGTASMSLAIAPELISGINRLYGDEPLLAHGNESKGRPIAEQYTRGIAHAAIHGFSEAINQFSTGEGDIEPLVSQLELRRKGFSQAGLEQTQLPPPAHYQTINRVALDMVRQLVAAPVSVRE